MLKIKNLQGKSEISIYSIDGKLHKTIFSNDTYLEVDTNELPKGIYVLKVINNEGITGNKFVK